jgi:peptidoglycan/xylan/chitin deacetylase (PgdA/CDA1 family)
MAFQGIPVLNYHAIDNNISEVTSRNVSVSLSSFKEQMSWLHNEGYKSIRPDELRALLLTKERPAGKHVLITFDDGYHSLYKCALEIMSGYGFTATLFLTTSYVGRLYDQADFEFVKHDPAPTWDELRALIANGWSIQSHGNSHSKMISLDKDALIEEVTVSKNIIEQNLGTSVYEFAFPYGLYNNEVITQLKAAGYQFAYSVHSGKIYPSSKRFHLPRIEINNMDTMDTFKIKVLTGYISPADARRSKFRDIAFANPAVKDLIEKWSHKMGYGNR